MDRRGFIETGSLLALAAYVGGARAQEGRSSFPPDATAEQVTEGIDLSGKTIVVTGCNSGIGLETMRVLALRGAHIIGTARTLERGQEACASVQGKATPVVLELSDFDSVGACAAAIRALDTPIDALVCNAGVLQMELQQVRGMEMQFVVNHLGHFILVNRLLDRVVAAPQGRVVVVGSMSHAQVPPGGIQFDNLSGQGWERQAYGHSKLANGLFSFELAKRLQGTRATSNSLHPGVVATNIMRNLNFTPPAGGGGNRGGGGGGFSFEQPAQGAATSCYLASHPSLAGVTGLYFVDCNPAEQSDLQKDPALAARLWQVSEELTRPYLA
jgi:NAD(P)-dependent dehydrogenase (short-subunit alcohol dehydrogenase family)